MSDPSELFDAGDLAGAIDAAVQLVKKYPTDVGRRGFLCELLCFAGQWERADNQLELIVRQDAESMMGAGLIRQLIRAETARQQCFQEGRLPEFLGEVTPLLRRHLEASIAVRDGDLPLAARLLTEAEQQRVPLHGTCNGQAFDDWRDLDDLCAPLFEILTTTGKYYWVPFELIQSIEFRAPRQARDLLWRSAHIVPTQGPEGEVFLPALYPNTAAASSDRLKLGHMTQWLDEAGGPTRGVGQRMFLVGSEDKSILELQRVDFVPNT